MADVETLVTRAQQGDEDALRALLRLAAPMLRSDLGGRIPSRWRAMVTEDDIIQQSFTEIFLQIGRFVPAGPGAFEAWVRTLARNNLRDAVRMLEAEKRGGGRKAVSTNRDESMELFFEKLLARSRSSPSRHAARNEAIGAMKRALETLPETYRRVVQLYDLDGLPIEDVARALDRTPGATYLLRNRAHRRLLELLTGTAGEFGIS